MGRMVQRAAAIFLAGLVGVSTWLAVDTQARAAFFRWCKEIYETYVVYHFSGNDPMQTSVYRPGWLPIGYEETSALSVPGFNQMVFQNQEGNQILFDYTLMQQGAVAAVVPETAILKAVEINDCYGELYLEGDPERASVLMWFDDQENLAFSLSACLPEDDILHIAQSILLS